MRCINLACNEWNFCELCSFSDHPWIRLHNKLGIELFVLPPSKKKIVEKGPAQPVVYLELGLVIEPYLSTSGLAHWRPKKSSHIRFLRAHKSGCLPRPKRPMEGVTPVSRKAMIWISPSDDARSSSAVSVCAASVCQILYLSFLTKARRSFYLSNQYLLCY